MASEKAISPANAARMVAFTLLSSMAGKSTIGCEALCNATGFLGRSDVELRWRLQREPHDGEVLEVRGPGGRRPCLDRNRCVRRAGINFDTQCRKIDPGLDDLQMSQGVHFGTVICEVLP